MDNLMKNPEASIQVMSKNHSCFAVGWSDAFPNNLLCSTRLPGYVCKKIPDLGEFLTEYFCDCVLLN